MRCFIFLSSSMLGFFFGKKEEQQQHEKSDCKRSVCRSILLYSPTKMTKSRNTATNVRLNRKFAAKSHVNMYFDLFLWRLFFALHLFNYSLSLIVPVFIGFIVSVFFISLSQQRFFIDWYYFALKRKRRSSKTMFYEILNCIWQHVGGKTNKKKKIFLESAPHWSVKSLCYGIAQPAVQCAVRFTLKFFDSIRKKTGVFVNGFVFSVRKNRSCEQLRPLKVVRLKLFGVSNHRVFK